jgi:transposase-like protein
MSTSRPEGVGAARHCPGTYAARARNLLSTKTVHEELMKYASSVVPSLSKTGISIPIVMNDGTGICNAIETYLPNLAHLKCWNHTINSAKVNINTSDAYEI